MGKVLGRLLSGLGRFRQGVFRGRGFGQRQVPQIVRLLGDLLLHFGWLPQIFCWAAVSRVTSFVCICSLDGLLHLLGCVFYGGQRVGLVLLRLGDQLVEFVPGIPQLVGRVALRLDRSLRSGLAEFVFRFSHVPFGRDDFAGDFLCDRDRLDCLPRFAGVVFETGLLVGELCGPGLFRVDPTAAVESTPAVEFGKFRLGFLDRLLR